MKREEEFKFKLKAEKGVTMRGCVVMVCVTVCWCGSCNIGYKYMKMFLVMESVVVLFRCVSWCIDVCGCIESLVVGGYC